MKPTEIPAALTRRYDIRELLGRGGFAVVFAAVDKRSGAQVALKLLTPDDDGTYSPDVRRRFLREVGALAQLSSPNTVRLLGHGEADGVLYAVFEHLAGQELSQYITAHGPLNGAEIEHILRQLLQALDEAHRYGMLHRDIKPENILVVDDTELTVKLLDFGLVRSLDDGSPSVTKTGELVGTPRYMSPEQLTNEPLTAASDLYSLGMVAYEMALGRDALQGGALMDQFDRLMSGHVFSVPALERVGPRVCEVIAKMTARRPADRYGSARQVLVALDDGLSPVIEERAGSGTPIALTAAVLLAGTLVLLAGALVLLAGDDDDASLSNLPAPAMRENPLEVQGTPEQTPSPTAEKKRPWYNSPGCFTEKSGPPANLFVPGDNSSPIPLILLFHDTAVDHLVFLNNGGFVPLAREHGFAVLSLGGNEREELHWNAWARPDPRKLNTAFRHDPVPSVLGEARRTINRFCIDLRRVYAVGHGDGAAPARAAACTKVVAATATVSNTTNPREEVDCRGRGTLRNIPRLRFNPTASEYVPVFGDPLCAGDPDILMRTLNDFDEHLADHFACTTDDPPFVRRQAAQRRSWSCPDNVPIISELVVGGSGWPGAARSPGGDPHDCVGETPDVDYAGRIWAFFDALPVLESP